MPAAKFDSPKLTFGQREGVEQLPSQMLHDHISAELATYVYAIIYDSMTNVGNYAKQVSSTWKPIMYEWHVRRLHQSVDSYSESHSIQSQRASAELFSKKYVRFYNFLQFVLSHSSCPLNLGAKIDRALQETQAGYRLIDGLFVRAASEEEADAIRLAFQVAAAHSAQGPRAHLRGASTALSSGAWGGAIRESISAVEAAAKVVEPSADTLGKALAVLERKQALPGHLKKAFGALYGYTSDTDGVRHALVFEDKPDVSEADALFMFGACAAFVSYLLTTAAARTA
jgi:hypothetical protein